MKTWKLEIPEAPPSANVFLRLHWGARVKLAKMWAWRLLAAHAAEIPHAKRKRIVAIEVRSPGRRDPQNSWTPCDKLVMDNLVRYGVLKDDSPRWCDMMVSTVRGEPRTRIEIREA